MASELLSRYLESYIPPPGPDAFQYILYNYKPEIGFNIFATVAYAAVLVAHSAWFFRYPRTRWIQAHLIMFSAFGLVSYILRSISGVYPFRPDYFVGQYVFTMIAPIWIVVAKLLALNKALKSSDDGRYAVFGQPKLIPMVLVGYQVLVAIIVAIGASMWCVGNIRILDNRPQAFPPQTGKYVILVGLGNQVGMLTVFLAIITWIFISITKLKPSPSVSSDVPGTGRISRVLVGLLFLTAGMIWVRSIFRLVESAQGFFGEAFSNEALFGLFEFAQMWTAAAIWACWPFAKSVESDTSGGTRKGSTDSVRKLVA